MNFPIMVDNALYCLRTQSLEQYTDQAARLISDGYYAIDRYYTRAYYGTGTDVSNSAFALIKRAMTFFFVLDAKIYHRGEFDIYKKVCDKVGYTSTDVNTLISYADKQRFNDYVDYISRIIRLRGEMESTNYQNLVYGLIMIAVMTDGTLTERAYSALLPFFNQSSDIKPSYRELMSEVFG